ncbi:hypothetical protein DPMN_182500 [Dreissena polymorpha]|uniref:Uncharacterized protein n=1 Tax=Dreissena polymorpha TaxID=45954 RepID=A0A9D4DFV7_DREPO|nr:hypothetical protein DPMN_182500 [Dreissena polymorpha]
MAEANAESQSDKINENRSAKRSSKQRNVSKGKAPVSSAKADNSKQDVDSGILQCLQQIQSSQKQYDQKVDSMLDRLKKLGETYGYDDCQDYHGQSCDSDYDDTDEVSEECESVKSGPCPNKMKSDSRFASMAKQFKGK